MFTGDSYAKNVCHMKIGRPDSDGEREREREMKISRWHSFAKERLSHDAVLVELERVGDRLRFEKLQGGEDAAMGSRARIPAVPHLKLVEFLGCEWRVGHDLYDFH